MVSWHFEINVETSFRAAKEYISELNMFPLWFSLRLQVNVEGARWLE